MSLGVSFERYLRSHWDVQRKVITTSPQRLAAGWGSVCGVFGDFNGFVKGVLSDVADESSDATFEDSKDPVDGSRGGFDEANEGGVSVGAKLPTCLYTK